MQHAACSMQHAASIRVPAFPCLSDGARSMPCIELQRDAAAKLNCAVVQQAPSDTQTGKNLSPTMPKSVRRIDRNRIRAENDQRARPYVEYLARYRHIVVQALAPLGRPTCTARGTHLVKRRTLLLGLHHQTPIRRLSGRKGELALRRAARAFACASCLSPSLCAAQHCVRVRALRCR